MTEVLFILPYITGLSLVVNIMGLFVVSLPILSLSLNTSDYRSERYFFLNFKLNLLSVVVSYISGSLLTFFPLDFQYLLNCHFIFIKINSLELVFWCVYSLCLL